MASNRDAFTSAPGAPQPGLWRFGRAVLDEQVAALQVDGTVIALDRSSYDVLLALLRHAGEVVAKDELLEAGWPGRVVSENSLAKAVSRLRQALGQDGDAIRVVHGYGYRLAAAVGFTPLDGERAAVPHEAERLREGDPVPHRPGWRLVRRLGHGSVGVTFLARSGNGEERAIKLADSEAGLRGLKREISLARYIRAVRDDLPDVAQVLDWNLSQPPFFLERTYFAHGHLAEWAAERGGLATLSRAERLALCAQLCEAVAGMHEIGLIHKDLKPENLYPLEDGAHWRLVLADLGAGAALPSPRLADLGITMSIAAEQMQQRAGSLLYLAPEVIAGEMPTQRSDVFALGMLVYQLVTGDLRRSLAPGWEADIDDELLRADIALAAAANPERRLLSARDFAERLRNLDTRRLQLAERHRVEQQHAHMRGVLERARARRPWLIATVAALMLGIATSSWLYVKALAASRAARENAAVADAVNRFFNQDVLGAASPYSQSGKSEPTVREAIDGAVARIDERLHDQPIVEATVRMAIGQAYGEAMQIAKAIEQERRAIALFEKHLGVDDPRTQQARYRLATDLTDNSRFDEARTLIEQTDALRARRGQTDLETTLLSHRASCYWHIWRELYDEGQPACEGVIATQLALDPADRNALIKARANLAVLHSRAGRFAQAEEQFTGIEQQFTLLRDHDSPTRLRFSYLHGMNLLELARYEEAARIMTAAHRGSMASLGADNPHTLEVEMGLARLHVLRGEPGQAVPLLRHAHAMYARQLGEDNHYTIDARSALDHALCATRSRAGGTTSPAATPACP